MNLKRFEAVYDATALKMPGLNSNSIGPIDLQDINLLVGKNASGKTTVANGLLSFSRILLNQGTHLFYGEYQIDLLDNKGDIYRYNYHGSSSIIKESLRKNDLLLIERTGTIASIYSEITQTKDEFNPPKGVSILLARRDERAYPYIEKIINWALGTFSFRFGGIHSYSSNFGNGIETFTAHEGLNYYLGEIGNEDKREIVNEFNTLGYKVELIDFIKEGEQHELIIREAGLKNAIRQSVMSQGMYRSLFLLLYIHFSIKKRKATLIIIDDLCEGLDYDRASKLGKLLFNKMKKNNVQFVATSNDSFLMNVVDIEYWNIISREGDKIKAFNYTNSKEKFDRFKLTGLNNFDLFTSDFLEIQ